MATQGRKDKVGYLLLSLLGAQPRPANKIIDVKHVWHRLLGVKSEGKCCHPQLLLSLSVEDRVNMLTPRNELRLFHNNEIAYPSTYSAANPPTVRSVLLTIDEYIAESKKTVSSPDLQPKLLCDEGLIQIGDGKQLFVLSLVIGTVENLDMLLLDYNPAKDVDDCYITYAVFTHNVMTDRVSAKFTGVSVNVNFNQRTSLRLRSSLGGLGRYFSQCPHLVTKICVANKDVGICSLDLRKMVPTDDLIQFVNNFCNGDKVLSIQERCYILPFDGVEMKGRRPFVDFEMTLKYEEDIKEVINKPNILTARSATELEDRMRYELERDGGILEARSGSCTQLDHDLGGVAYTNMDVRNTARYKNAAGNSLIQTNELTELIKKMYDSFTSSQEKLQYKVKPTTSDMQVQCDGYIAGDNGEKKESAATKLGSENEVGEKVENEHLKFETNKSEPCIKHCEKVKMTISVSDRDAIMQKFVDELEDWKEKQQELFKLQLKRKEDYHLELLAREWATKRLELECKLSKGIEQCRNLAADLSRATDDFRLRGYRNTEREKKLLDAKKALEAHYTAKYQELREASQKMEDDMNHQIRLKDMTIVELETRLQQLEKQVDVLKNSIKNCEKDAESRYSGLTKDQTASLIQELRCLEEKLDSATQSKAFFKEQWGRAVRELHAAKVRARAHVLAQLRRDRTQLADGDVHLNTSEDRDEVGNQKDADIKRLKDDFYVDILASTPALESHSVISTAGLEGLDSFDDFKNMPKNPLNEKLNDLISQRDKLVQQENPDEEMLKQLNQDIRSMLLNCGT